MEIVACTQTEDHSVDVTVLNLLKTRMFAMSGERDSLIDNENNSSIATHQWRINSSEIL